MTDAESLRARANEAYHQSVPEFGYSHQRDAFEAGYLAHAAQQPSEPTRVQVAARKAGKNSALADAIVERANAQGLRVEFVAPSPSREQIARAMHADDLAHDREVWRWEDMSAKWHDRYRSNADAVLALLDGNGS